MELLLIIGGIWFLGWLYETLGGGGGSSSRNSQSPQTRQRPSRPPPQRKDTNIYRPSRTSSSNQKIVFRENPKNTSGSSSIPNDLSGLHDAFTGAPLDESLGLYQCQNCQVFYHNESFQVLREANGSACVSCQSTSVFSLVQGAASQGGRNYEPDLVTLANFREHVGSVVTFEGFVYKVNESRRGSDYAVMFENKSWTRGFKLVFFRGSINAVGGSRFIKSLDGKTVRVRGLLIKHDRFGYEIIISQRSMILSVSE